MAQAYIDQYNSVKGDGVLRMRTCVAIGVYARYVLGNQAGYTAARVAWAKAALADVEGQADQIVWGVVGDPAYQSAGESIADADLQSAAEATVNAIYP